MDETNLKTLAEAAVYFKCSYSTIYKRYKEGSLVAYRLGRKVFVDVEGTMEKMRFHHASQIEEERER